MTETREFRGKTIEAAIQSACSSLEISKEELKYDVISAGTSGIFGIVGRKDAKIKAYLPNDENDEWENEKQRDIGGIRAIVDEAFKDNIRLNLSQSKLNNKAETFKNQKQNRKKSDKLSTALPIEVSEIYIELGITTLQKIADMLTDNTVVKAETCRNRLILKIEGGQTGILIGRKGQTLDAMQFLIDKIVNRQSESKIQVKIDIEGYIETRKTNLKHMAFKLAEKVKKTGQAVTINQMNAQDRRIVHMVLKNDKQVRTKSIGNGYYRRLVIFPQTKAAISEKRHRLT